MKILSVIFPILTWPAFGAFLITFGLFVWKTFGVGGWLWAIGSTILPIPVIPIFAFMHWEVMKTPFLYVLISFVLFAIFMICTMAFAQR